MHVYDPLIETLISHFTGPEYQSELLEAKREFFEDAGIVDEDGAQFETRMSQFLDWYLFTREQSKFHIPPVKLTQAQKLVSLSDLESDYLDQLVKAKHSIFEFIKVRGDDVYVRDLFADKKLVLRHSYVAVGFNPEELFDARIIPLDNSFVFTKGFCFHPTEAKKFILKEVKKIRHLDQAQHEALMLRLMKMRYKLEQYRHIRLEYIYTNEPRLKL